MKRFYLFLFAFSIFLLTKNETYSQCNITAYASHDTICLGDTVYIWSDGGCPQYALNNNFDLGNAGAGWTATTGVDFSNPCNPSANGTIYMWMGSSVPIPRTLTTVAFNMIAMNCSGGNICFDMKYATQSQSSPCEGPDMLDEGVSLQYSTNGGTTWIDIAYFQPDGTVLVSNTGNTGSAGLTSPYTTPFTSWDNYCFPIPAAAITTTTQFRWIQTDYSSQSNDHWGLDNVEIYCSAIGQTINWSHGPTTLSGGTQSPTTTTTYTVTVADGLGNSAVDSVRVVVLPIPPPPTASGTTVNCGDSATVSASGSSTGYEWFSDIGCNNQIGSGTPFTTGSLSQDTTIYVRAATNGQCPSTATAVHITVIPINDPTATGTTVYCGDSATVTASGSIGDYEWYSDINGNNPIGTGSPFTFGPLTHDTTIYVAATNGTGSSSGQTYNFTNCGVSGRVGPTQAQVNTAYSGTSLDGQINVIGDGIQEWIVPQTGTYRIEAAGAQGSTATGTTGGLGAYMSGDFDLVAGDVIRILVGQNAPNTSGRENLSSSGGGGSFVTKAPHNSNASILVIAGGGGGTGNEQPATANGTTAQNGQTGSHGAGGTNGDGGTSGISSAGAGGGFFTNGVTSGTSGGNAYINGGQGGSINTTYSVNGGGFGGGGSVISGGNSRYGGGGGYSGGSGSSSLSGATTGLWGGGGGSYNSGTNQNNISGVNSGHGYVTITNLSSARCVSNLVPVHVTVLPLADPIVNSPVNICMPDSVTLTASGSSGNYNWYDDPLGTNLVGTGANFTTPTLNNSTTYYVQAYTGSGIPAQTYNFTNCGAIGSVGPTQAQVNTSYSGTSLDGQITINTQGIQEWTVPQTGVYTIEAAGGQGYGTYGGRGAYMSGEFNLTAGTVLKIIVGQEAGAPVSSSNQYGGGGGSFVTDATNTPLIIAGGGGGSWATAHTTTTDAPTTNNGNSGMNGPTNGAGGTAGSGGATASSADGGGGLLGDGGGTAGGSAFVNGGEGGVDRGHGGFGGGGGTSSWDNRRGGGGGGYSGGGAAGSTTTGFPEGGGGGSYNIGTNQNNIAGNNTGNGYVTISTTSTVSNCVSNLIPVVINAAPNPVITATANPNSICVGNNAVVSATSNDPSTTYNWNSLGAGANHTVSPTTTTTYIVTGTTAAGCSGIDSVTVTISPNLYPTITANPSTICENDSSSLTVTNVPTTSTFIWSTGDLTNPITVSPAATTTYQVTASDGSGCSGTADVQVVVNPLPLITVTNDSVCRGDFGNLTASGGTSYIWDNGSTQNPLSDNPSQTTSYIVTGTDANGCSSTAQGEILVVDPPTLQFVSADAHCYQSDGSAEVIPSGGSGNYTYTWNTIPVVNTADIQNQAPGTYHVTVSDNGCEASGSVVIGNIPGPIAAFSINPSQAEINEIIQFTDASIGAVLWDWDFGDGNFGSGIDPTHQYNSQGSYDVWLYIEDDYGCKDSTSNKVVISSMFTFYIPNAFSPDGNAQNEVFLPQGVGVDEERYLMQIFDRWGKKVFETTDITKGWDGRIDGKEVHESERISEIFIYYIKVFEDGTDTAYEYRGTITLLK
jgi:gliding motility-associated-like protein